MGSDLDPIVLLRETMLSAAERYRTYCPEGLPVPADLWTYTLVEWRSLAAACPQLHGRIEKEWLDLAS